MKNDLVIHSNELRIFFKERYKKYHFQYIAPSEKEC